MSRLLFSVALAAMLGSVSVTSAPAADLSAGITSFKGYASDQLHATRTQAEALLESLRAKDLEGARKNWTQARIGWERVETITGPFFPDLDKAIDAWPDGWSGFHAIEARLYGKKPKAEDIVPIAQKLVVDLTEIETKLKTTDLTVQELYNGMASLAFEVGESKSKGNESRRSGTSLNDLHSNIEGVLAVYESVFAAPLKDAKPELSSTIATRIATLLKSVDVPSMAKINQRAVEKAGEGLALSFVDASSALGLTAPTLESDEDE